MSTSNFLAEILEAKRRRLIHTPAQSLALLRREALRARAQSPRHALRSALSRTQDFNVIGEIKRVSPWQGVIKSEIDPAAIALEYSRAGAAAISVLTEEDFFNGSLADLRAVQGVVTLPVLRKDFILEQFQIYESALAGADAVLLIAAALEQAQLTQLRHIAEEELGIDALVEVHTRREMNQAFIAGASLINVNNRDLNTFEVSLDISVEIAGTAPKDTFLVSESGLHTGKQLRSLRRLGYKGFLIGEALMRGSSPGDNLNRLLQIAKA